MKPLIYILFDVILDKVVKVTGIVLVLVILVQIGGRYLLTQPFTWTEEFSRFLFVWFAMLGSALTLKNRMHLGIEYFYEKFNETFKRYIDVFVQILVIFFGIILAYYGFDLVRTGGIQQSPVLRWSMSYFYLAIPVTGVLFVIYGIYELINRFKNMRHT